MTVMNEPGIVVGNGALEFVEALISVTGFEEVTCGSMCSGVG